MNFNFLYRIVLLLFLCMIAHSIFASDKLSDEYWKSKRVVFAIYGNDCVNCYLGASTSYAKLKAKYPVVFVLGGVQKRISASFFKEKIGESSKLDTIILNDSLFKILSPTSSSCILVIEDNVVKLSMPFKEIQWELLYSKINDKIVIVDTFDISSIAGTGQTGFKIMDDEKAFITNDLNGKTYIYNFKSKSIERKLDFQFIKEMDSVFIDLNVNLNSDEKRNNYRIQKDIEAQLGGKLSRTNQPYYLDSFIYVPVTHHVLKMMHYNGDSSLSIMPSQFLVKLSMSTLNVLKIYSFLYQINTTENLYNVSYGGEIVQNKFYMINSSVTHDSIIVMYDLDSFNQTPKVFYPINYPNYFPKTNASGINIVYLGLFNQIKGESTYVFNVDPCVYFLKSGKSVQLTGFDSQKFSNNSTPKYWISKLIDYNGSLVLLGGYNNDATYAYKYDPDTNQLISKLLISDKQLNVINYLNGKLFWYELGEENAYIYSSYINF